MPVLKVIPLTVEHFAPFGDALMVSDKNTQRIINQGSTIRFDGLSTIDVLADEGKPCLCLFRSRGAELNKPLSVLERHQHGSQTFIPLTDCRMLVVVAPATNNNFPDENTMVAFLAAPGQGVTLKPGVWHHPLITMSDGDVIVLERRGRGVDCDISALHQSWLLEL